MSEPQSVRGFYVGGNPASEVLPNGVVWSTLYRSDSGADIYAVYYDRIVGDVPATRYASSRASIGLIVGTRVIINVVDIDGTLYASRVALDEDADYPECPHCGFLRTLRVTPTSEYPRYLAVCRNKEKTGLFKLVDYDVSEHALHYNYDEPLLEIQCLHCRAEYTCDTAGDRQAAGVYYRQHRHSFVNL